MDEQRQILNARAQHSRHIYIYINCLDKTPLTAKT